MLMRKNRWDEYVRVYFFMVEEIIIRILMNCYDSEEKFIILIFYCNDL